MGVSLSSTLFGMAGTRTRNLHQQFGGTFGLGYPADWEDSEGGEKENRFSGLARLVSRQTARDAMGRYLGFALPAGEAKSSIIGRCLAKTKHFE